jgi:hypothetical protein
MAGAQAAPAEKLTLREVVFVDGAAPAQKDDARGAPTAAIDRLGSRASGEVARLFRGVFASLRF